MFLYIATVRFIYLFGGGVVFFYSSDTKDKYETNLGAKVTEPKLKWVFSPDQLAKVKQSWLRISQWSLCWHPLLKVCF